MIRPVLFATAVAFFATPALAEIGMDDARRIAGEHGVVTFEEVERDDNKWEVEGRDAAGREIELDIDRRTGAVVKREVD